MMIIKKYGMFEMEGEIGEEKYNCLIIAPNVEKRSQYLCTKYGFNNYESTIVFDFENFHQPSYNESGIRLFDEVDKNKLIVLTGNENNAIQQFAKHVFKSKCNIAIDITGFSIPQLLQIMRILFTKCNNSSVDFFYTEPLHYKYKEGYFDQYHPELVERFCAPIRGYYHSGRVQAESLVILLGFENGLANMVFSRIAEDSQDNGATYAINGLPSFSIKLKDVSILNNIDFLSNIDMGNVLSASANNPFSVFNVLIDIYDKDRAMPLNICPIGSKPMALGAGLFALYMNSHTKEKPIKVIYPNYIKTHFDKDELPGRIWKYQVKVSDIL